MKTCTVVWCDRKHAAKGLCQGHHQRLRLYGDVMADKPFNYRHGPIQCSFSECDGTHQARNLCRGHYEQWKRGKVLTKINPRRKNGEGSRVDGYVLKSKNGKRYGEHRIVMEGILGRDLLPNENVHHVNGIRDDNRPENLELWVTSQPSGQRVIDLIAWAKEILERYDS